MFKDGLKKFSYDALSFGTDDIHYLETELRDDLEFKNLSLSMYVYPTGTPTGTLLHYVFVIALPITSLPPVGIGMFF
jgi:hypothetical protein